VLTGYTAETNKNSIATIVLNFDNDHCYERCILPYKKLSRPKLGLALSGGGLRGAAQIGVLKALENNKISIDYIVGTSIGAIIGGLYASGYSADEIWDFTKSINWSEILNDTPERSTLFLGEKQKESRALLQFRLDNLKPVLPKALTPGHKLADILTYMILNAPYHSKDFNTLKIPLKIVTSDLLSGEKIIRTQGDLAEAMRASIAIPLLLSPVTSDTLLLADGGILDNIPVEEVKKMGADIVLAVDTTSPLRKKNEMNAPWEVADQVTTIMQQNHNREQLALADEIITFNDFKSTSTNFTTLDYLYSEGIKRTNEKVTRLKTLVNIRKMYPTDSTLFSIDKVKIDTLGSSDSFNTYVDTTRHQKISKDAISFTLQKVYEQGWLSDAKADIYTVNGDTVLAYHFLPAPIIKEFVFYGNSLLPDSTIHSIFHELLNKPINFFKTTQAFERLIKIYRKRGLSLAHISDITYSPEDEIAKIYVNEGMITSISCTGIHRTKNFVIERELPFKINQVFQIEKAKQGLDNVYGTGLFNSVKLKAEQYSNENKVILEVQEKPPTVVRIGAHFDQERKGSSFVEISNENLFGTGNDLTLHSLYGMRDLNFSAEYSIDRIFKTYLTSRINIRSDFSKQYSYDDFKGVGEYGRYATGAVLSLGQQIERFGTISGFMRLEQIHIRSISGHGYDPGKLFVNTIGFSSLVDTRDQIPFVRTGRLYEFIYEVSSGTFLGADISYFKVKNLFKTYHTISRNHTLCLALFWGTSDLTTPFSEQFRIGEANSFQGLREGELQGRHVIHGSIEYRPQIFARRLFDIYLSFRYDIAAAWENTVDIYKENFIDGRGLGIALKTPLGPLNLSYGKSSNGKSRIYLIAGYNF
jgi:NTE family protein